MANSSSRFGQWAKREALQHGWGVRRLAREAGVQESTLSRIFRKNGQPQPRTIYKVAAALGVDPQVAEEQAHLPAEAEDSGRPPDLSEEQVHKMVTSLIGASTSRQSNKRVVDISDLDPEQQEIIETLIEGARRLKVDTVEPEWGNDRSYSVHYG